MHLKVKKLHPDAIIPQYQTAGAACFDLHAIDIDGTLPRDLVFKCGSVVVDGLNTLVFRTGLSFEIPHGWVMLIYSRSGHGFKNDTRLSNCVGVIDSDYRGEVKVKLISDAGGELRVYPGDRIAQAMLIPAPQCKIEVVSELSETERGECGFGSTGK